MNEYLKKLKDMAEGVVAPSFDISNSDREALVRYVRRLGQYGESLDLNRRFYDLIHSDRDLNNISDPEVGDIITGLNNSVFKLIGQFENNLINIGHYSRARLLGDTQDHE